MIPRSLSLKPLLCVNVRILPSMKSARAEPVESRPALARPPRVTEYAVTTSENDIGDDLFEARVLLDLRLPDMDGIDVLRALKGRHPDTAVIIITGFGQIQSAVEAMKAGATDYLEKPFEHLDKLKLAAR